jgi:hypothetical protein
MPERRQPPDPQGEPTAPLSQPSEPPRQAIPSEPDSVWAPHGRQEPPAEGAGDASPGAGQGAATQPIGGWGGQSNGDGSPPTWRQPAQDAPPPYDQPTQATPPGWGQPPAGWGQQPSGRGPRRVPVVAAIVGALLVIAAVGAVVLVRGVQAARTVASPATAPAPFAPGTGSGGGANPGGSGGSGSGGGGGGGSGALGSGSVRLPDRVDGLDRLELNEQGVLEGQEGMLDMVTRTGAIDGWGLGAYGDDPQSPEFVLLVVKAKEAGTAGMLGDAMANSIRNSLGGDLSDPRQFSHGGVRYDCSEGQVGNLCSFQDGALIGIGFGRGGDLSHLSRLTDHARHGVRS